MANYVLTHKAAEDLSAIWNYTCDEWSEAQADKCYFMLLEYGEDIANNKLSGKYYPEINSELFGLRAGEHILFYRKMKNNKTEIVRMLHSRMDLKNRIRE
jgi:toxin ParE1/3/4